MKPKVYVETSVISYLASRPSRDLIVAAHQKITYDWWQCRERFDLYVSELVVDEANAGNAEAARERQVFLAGLPLLAVNEAVILLAQRLVADQALPSKAAQDAVHLAIAAVNRAEYLVTWNCRHLANATMRARIEAVCEASGLPAPIICTPEELLGE
jgi:predicted nucleic acid-binding protein